MKILLKYKNTLKKKCKTENIRIEAEYNHNCKRKTDT